MTKHPETVITDPLVTDTAATGNGHRRSGGDSISRLGYGIVARQGGVGPNHFAAAGGGIIYELGDQITPATPNVKNVTANLAGLVAFTRALDWAFQHPYARDRLICIRYSSAYAANIATGAWRPKKHKAMAAEARHAWDRLRRLRGAALCIQHAPASTTMQQRALATADACRVSGSAVDVDTMFNLGPLTAAP